MLFPLNTLMPVGPCDAGPRSLPVLFLADLFDLLAVKLGLVCGAHTLRYRQSSMALSSRPDCRHWLPGSKGPRTPLHDREGCGAFQRSSPTRGAATIIPLKTLTAPSATNLPRSAPERVVTATVSSLVNNQVEGTDTQPAISSEAKPAAKMMPPGLMRAPGSSCCLLARGIVRVQTDAVHACFRESTCAFDERGNVRSTFDCRP